MLLYASLILLVVFAILVCFFRDLLYAAVSLALASVMLSVVLFQYGANIAAVFELSVCAGLITVLFVSTVSMTKDSDQANESRLPAYFLPFILVLFLGLDFFLVKWLAGSTLVGAGFPATPAELSERVLGTAHDGYRRPGQPDSGRRFRHPNHHAGAVREEDMTEETILLLLSGLLLFMVGVYLMFAYRNLLRVILGVEVMAKGVTLVLLAAGVFRGSVEYIQALIVTFIIVETILAAVVLAITFVAQRIYNSLDIRNLSKLKG